MLPEIVKVIIPSHLRAGRVTTIGKVLNAALCVPEAQAGEYREHYPDVELVVHPDNVRGLPPKRQWMYEKFGSLFMLDDDIRAFSRLWRKPPYEVSDHLTPEETWDCIQSLALFARELGVTLFGLNSNADQRNYKAFLPFRLNMWIPGAAMGLFPDRNIRFDSRFYGMHDYFLACLNAYHNRISLVDTRIGVLITETMSNPGGMAEFRTRDTERTDYELMVKMFGERVVNRKAGGVKTQGGKRNRFSVLNEWAISLNIPL